MGRAKPKVSIIMGIYNCSLTLEEAIYSLFDQTFQDWELIMCDDGSTDETFKIASSFAKRYENIHVLHHKQNKGLAHCLNACLKKAKGEYIARQDGDDRSRQERLEKEVDFLDNHQQFDIVSTGMNFFDDHGFWGHIQLQERPNAFDFIPQTPFCHAPSMFRRQAILKVDGYDVTKKTLRVEDYHLWFKMYANGSRGYNLQEILYEVRDDRDAIKRRKYSMRLRESYVRLVGYKMLKLPLHTYFYAMRPLIVGLVPVQMYKYIRKFKYNQV
ncbi:glycosyltransferase family 2 protein [Alkalihalobacillus pseudalcaliphilus]|uniref:glycosyltransferase family 2 protein n=1 Tax=Alkalihalobacillus pseudalcaliphilus TaxID=79884 RepID=UPI00064DEFAF|nr:glycosyltransferase [Alkalihalobacillus pseudalcaliphilus]KMK75028.1 hypothetical protein AB990_16290 [Alkalihalobacillus pseudalcaliphilus]